MSNGRLRFEWQSTSDGAAANGLNVYVDDLKVAFFTWHTGM
nr:MAG TPA: RIM binding protein 2 domain, RIM binding protein [Caudoviricetes sp.]